MNVCRYSVKPTTGQQQRRLCEKKEGIKRSQQSKSLSTNADLGDFVICDLVIELNPQDHIINCNSESNLTVSCKESFGDFDNCTQKLGKEKGSRLVEIDDARNVEAHLCKGFLTSGRQHVPDLAI
jgi:hypothetical protein